MRKPINFKAAWNRNLNPVLRAASFVGLYSRETRVPVRFACRIWFADMIEAEFFIRRLPSIVGGRISSFRVAGDPVSNTPPMMLGQYRLEMELSGRRGSVATIPRTRYERLRDDILRRGFNIDWQHDIGLPRVYATRAAFEMALFETVRPDPRIPD